MDSRILLPSSIEDDEKEETTLRPKSLEEFIGQQFLKDNLNVYLFSAKKRNVPLEHILLSGPPGLGKTTIANILANEMGGDIINITGPALKKVEELVTLLISLKRGDILFIDEVHGLNKVMSEILYPVMEDFKLLATRISGSGNNKKSDILKIPIKKFTMIGATTRIGSLAAPFRDRFGIQLRFELYGIKELQEVINRSSSMLGVPITPEGVTAIASCSRGTPRIANRLLRRVRDFALFKGEKEITKKVANSALFSMRIDKMGLDDLDRKIIQNIYEHHHGGPVGIKTIAMSVGEEVRSIEEVYEPYLVFIGFMRRTQGGREITSAAIDHLVSVADVYGIKFKKKQTEKKVVNMSLTKGDANKITLYGQEDML